MLTMKRLCSLSFLIAILLLHSIQSSANSSNENVSDENARQSSIAASSNLFATKVKLYWAKVRLNWAETSVAGAESEFNRAQGFNDAHYKDTTWADRRSAWNKRNTLDSRVRALEYRLSQQQEVLPVPEVPESKGSSISNLPARASLRVAKTKLFWAKVRLSWAETSVAEAESEFDRANSLTDRHYYNTTWADRRSARDKRNTLDSRVRELEYLVSQKQKALGAVEVSQVNVSLVGKSCTEFYR